MKLNYLSMKDNIAPFQSCLVSPASWGLPFKTPFIQMIESFDGEPFDMSVDEIIAYALQNNAEGIVLGGGDWTKQLEDFFELIERLCKYDNLKLMVYTPHNIDSFYYKVGEYLLTATGEYDEFFSTGVPLTPGEEIEAVTRMGVDLFDSIVNDDYLLMAGSQGKSKMYLVEKDKDGEIQ